MKNSVSFFIFCFRRISLIFLTAFLLAGIFGVVSRGIVSQTAAASEHAYMAPWDVEKLRDDDYLYRNADLSQDSLIRLHILANSDSREDQELKYIVRDAVVDLMGHRLALTADLDEARRMLQASQEQIVACAEEAIQQQGYSYSVALVWDVREFPTRAYGNVTLPAGEYESVRILIGEAEGANWWCVMFPPLCFIAEDTATTEDTATAERYIYQTAEGYQLHRGISVAPKDIGCAEDTASAEDTTSREQASEQGQGGTKRNAADSVDFSRYDEAQGGSLLTDGSGPVQKRFFFMDFVKSLFGG